MKILAEAKEVDRDTVMIGKMIVGVMIEITMEEDTLVVTERRSKPQMIYDRILLLFL